MECGHCKKEMDYIIRRGLISKESTVRLEGDKLISTVQNVDAMASYVCPHCGESFANGVGSIERALCKEAWYGIECPKGCKDTTRIKEAQDYYCLVCSKCGLEIVAISKVEGTA